MATIKQLPFDVIAQILEYKSINSQDLIRFGSTCNRFQEFTHDNKLCEKKYYQSCPTAEKRNNTEKQKKIFHHINFNEIIKKGLYYIQMLKYYVLVMSENRLRNTDKKQLERFLHSITKNSMMYYFVWDEMNRISAQKSCQLLSNLTREYNFKLIFYCLKQYRFIHKQIKFMKTSETKLILEKQLTIAAQYFQPHISYSFVQLWLDNIVQTVLFRLKNEYPAHSICSMTLEQFSFWRDNNIDDNFWNEIECKQIMYILEEYIFLELEIQQLYEFLMSSNLKAKYIRYIAGRFRTYLLTLTYHIVARRLGIRNILNLTYGEDILVIWKPEYNTNDWDNAEYFHIDEKSKLLYPSNIVKRRYRNNELILPEPSNDIELTQEIMRNFYRKLMYNNYDCEWNFNIFFNFLNQCYGENVKDIDIETEYENITNIIEIKSKDVIKKIKRRPTKFKFAVGMIVTHTWFDRFCDNHDGVIVGWHHECERMFKDKLEKTIMFPYLRQFSRHYHFCMCKKSSKNAHQPHYIILTEGNIICYGRQDQLSIRPPKKIKNIEIGRYFSRFEGTYYVPNESLRKRYPKDTAAIVKILAKR